MTSSTPSSSDSLSAPSETIERVLHIAPKVHVYAIPPLSSNKGHQASAWTAPPSKEIFTARLRVVETSDPDPAPASSKKPSSTAQAPSIRVSVLLEDPKTGELFAAAPYTVPAVVEAAVDSSRFFAVRVVGEGNRKAVLGIGFEERGEALDFSIALQEARKVLGLEGGSQPGTPVGSTPKGAAIRGRGKPGVESVKMGPLGAKKDWSLKEGEMLHLDIGGKMSTVRSDEGGGSGAAGGKGIEPPSGGGQLSATGTGFGLLPPPPSAKAVREETRRSREIGADESRKTLEELGFDDGEFGEFQ